MNIFLIGFMGTGKSMVSRYLGTHYGMDVMEMDQVIAEREQMSIADIFAAHGEEYFRKSETALLLEMRGLDHMAVSCGGGTVLRDCNVEEMRRNGHIVLLTASPETILERVKDSEERPLLNGNKNVDYIARLMEKRRVKYESAADITVCTDGKSAEEICKELMAELSNIEHTHRHPDTRQGENHETS